MPITNYAAEWQTYYSSTYIMYDGVVYYIQGADPCEDPHKVGLYLREINKDNPRELIKKIDVVDDPKLVARLPEATYINHAKQAAWPVYNANKQYRRAFGRHSVKLHDVPPDIAALWLYKKPGYSDYPSVLNKVATRKVVSEAFHSYYAVAAEAKWKYPLLHYKGIPVGLCVGEEEIHIPENLHFLEQELSSHAPIIKLIESPCHC